MITEPAGRWAIRDVRLVTPRGVTEGTTVVCEGDRISDITTGAAPVDARDGRGMLLIPGLVDTHSDGLEKERSPRRTVQFPVDFALRSFEGRLRAAGVTTVYHGVGFEERPRSGRSIELATSFCRSLHERREHHGALVDHRLLVRTEARSTTGVEPALAWIERFTVADEDTTVPPLLSFEDHTPGQGQYRDVDQFRAAMDPASLPDGETVDSMVERIVAEAEAHQHLRDVNRSALAELARARRIRLLAHDCEDAEDVATAHAHGATIAEFPLSVDAARRARELGMAIVMGAPNALRGGSHSGNVSAAEVVTAGLCDVLASDYQPSTLLASGFELAARHCCNLWQALQLVTSGPARAAGLTDRGTIRPGQRADLLLVDDAGRWPEVVASHRPIARADAGMVPA